MEFASLSQRLNFYLGAKPVLSEDVFLAANATIRGKVTIGAGSSVWFQTVIRADINEIKIGERTNIQDGAILHVANQYPLIVGDEVSCGHGAILHACTIENMVLIGMRATVMDGAVIGEGSVIGANTLVTKGSIIPPQSVVLGSPGKIIRQVTAEELGGTRLLAEKYVAVSFHYRNGTSGN